MRPLAGKAVSSMAPRPGVVCLGLGGGGSASRERHDPLRELGEGGARHRVVWRAMLPWPNKAIW